MNFAAFDVETSGTLPEYALQPWRVSQGKAWLTSLAWVWREPQYSTSSYAGGLCGPAAPAALHKEGCFTSCFASDMEMISTMLQWALDTDHVLVGWNVVFDLAWLYAYADGRIFKLLNQVRFMDAMLLWRHFDLSSTRDHSYSLKTAVPIFFPEHAGYEAEVDYHGTDPEELKKLHEYNIKDCIFTLRLARKFWYALSAYQRRVAVVEAASLKLVARANLEGMLIDVLEAHQLSAFLKQEAAARLKSLAPYGITEEVIRSPKQLSSVFYDRWKLPVTTMTDKGARSTDKVALHRLALRDPRVKEVKEYRDALNNDTKFAEAPLAACAYNQDRRAHPQARVFSTYSGRLTYSSAQGKNKDKRQIGFALHQEKRDPRFRRIVVPPPGFTLMEFDAAGQEYRWMAVASGDPVMLQLCQPGEDPHAFMGARIGAAALDNISYLKAKDRPKIAGLLEGNLRQCGKVANLSLQYRTGYKKLQQIAEVDYSIALTLDQARRIYIIYQETYTQVPIYWHKQITNARALGYVETIPGRRVRLAGEWAGPNAWALESTAINYRIQGTGAEQKYLALMCVKGYIDEIGARFAWDMHDGLYFYVPTDKVYDAANYIKDILDNLPYEAVWKFKPPIPMPWDCKVGSSWGDLKPFEFK